MWSEYIACTSSGGAAPWTPASNKGTWQHAGQVAREITYHLARQYAR